MLKPYSAQGLGEGFSSVRYSVTNRPESAGWTASIPRRSTQWSIADYALVGRLQTAVACWWSGGLPACCQVPDNCAGSLNFSNNISVMNHPLLSFCSVVLIRVEWLQTAVQQEHTVHTHTRCDTLCAVAPAVGPPHNSAACCKT